jgi:TonB family protein
MKRPLFLLLLVTTPLISQGQVRVRLNYTRDWMLTTQDSAQYIRIGIFDTTNFCFAGTVVDLYRTGQHQMRGNYSRNSKEGEFNFYYSNGKLEATGKFEKNVRAGIWKYFYRNGQPKMEAEFIPVLGDEPRINFLNDSTGKPLLTNGTGKWIEEVTYSNGVTARITGEYKNYEKHGTWTFTVSNDKAIREEEFEDGRFVKGVLRNTGAGRIRVDEPLSYSLYLTDKFFNTESYVARPGIDFRNYPWLPSLVINGKITVNPKTIPPLPPSGSGEVFTSGEQPPEPPTGMADFYRSISSILHYPPNARRKGIQGKVSIEFIVEKDGSITNVKVAQGIGGGCDEEAARVVTEYSRTNKWKPGLQNGSIVRQRYLIQITFKIG